MALEDSSSGRKLYLACRSCDISALKRHLKSSSNPDLNQHTFHDETILDSILIGGFHWDVLLVCLEHGLDINCETSNGSTPLMLATKKGEHGHINDLLEKGANVDSENYDGVRAIHLAVECFDISALKILVDAGADVNARTINNDVAPFDIAIRTSNLEAIDLLLQGGCKYENGWNCLHIASFYGFYLSLPRLLKSMPQNIENDRLNGPLHLASQQGHLECVEVLLRLQSDLINRPGEDGMTALHFASVYKHIPVIKCLIESGADINAQTEYGCTPLLLGIQTGDTDVVAELIARGADVNVGKYDSWSPLHAAVRLDQDLDESVNGSKEIVRVLLENKCNCDMQDDDGRTALHVGAAMNKPICIETLLADGANQLLFDKSGWLPLHTAIHHGHADIATRFLKVGEQTIDNSEISPNNPIDVDIRTRESRETGLMLACKAGHNGIVDILLDKGAAMEAENSDGMRPLELACSYDHPEIVETLLENGAATTIVLNDDQSFERISTKCKTLIQEYRKVSHSPKNKCGICLEPLNQPRFLECCHPFCLPCLEKRIDDIAIIQCPTCKEHTLLPLGFEPNDLLGQIPEMCHILSDGELRRFDLLNFRSNIV